MRGLLTRLRGARSGRWIYHRIRATLIVAMALANLIGAVVVSSLAIFVVPDIPPIGGSLGATLAMVGAYVAVAIPVGVLRGIRRFGDMKAWLPKDLPPTPEQQLTVLRGPLRLALTIGSLWALAALLFGGLVALDDLLEGVKVLAIVGFGGVTTTAIAYLIAERLLRDAAARALQAGGEARRVGFGVAMRTVLTWALATGVPVVGLVLIGAASLMGASGTKQSLALATVSLGGIALVVGLLAMVFAARATSDPIVSVRRALARVEAGDLDVEVPVYDGTEVGLLQAGFNRMAGGLREREKLRDLFGRHVGEDVARAALEGGIELGGEVREVAALFVDVVGSTSFAARHRADEVVAMLNRFFAIVVEVVEANGGSVNKFEGDAALAIFGAPAPLEDRAGCALKAARTLGERIRTELDDADAAVGVSGGEAVAGNVGAAHRFEYTVIGDPVNEAARLTELAKSYASRVAASEALVAAAGPAERAHWHHHEDVTLRGRDTATRIYVPRTDTSSSG